MKDMPENTKNTIVNSKVIDVTNLQWYTDEGETCTVVYVHQSRNNHIQGFYVWGHVACMNRHVLLQCKDPPVGYIEVQFTVVRNILLYNRDNEEYDPRSIYTDYCKDMLIRQYYDCSYTQYLQVLIDRICDNDNDIAETGDEVDLYCTKNDVNICDTDDGITKANTNDNPLQVPRINSDNKAARPYCGNMYNIT